MKNTNKFNIDDKVIVTLKQLTLFGPTKYKGIIHKIYNSKMYKIIDYNGNVLGSFHESQIDIDITWVRENKLKSIGIRI